MLDAFSFAQDPRVLFLGLFSTCSYRLQLLIKKSAIAVLGSQCPGIRFRLPVLRRELSNIEKIRIDIVKSPQERWPPVIAICIASFLQPLSTDLFRLHATSDLTCDYPSSPQSLSTSSSTPSSILISFSAVSSCYHDKSGGIERQGDARFM